MNPKITWKTIQFMHSNARWGYVGKWPCFEVVWDSFSKKDAEKPYKLLCRLPGIKDNLGNFSQEDAEAKATKILAHWIAGLSKNDESKETT